MSDELLQRIMKNSDTIGHVLNNEVITKQVLYMCVHVYILLSLCAVPLQAGATQQRNDRASKSE